MPDNDEPDHEAELFRLARRVKAVRDMQRAYFKIRDPRNLAQCKAAEHGLDAEVGRIMGRAAFAAGGREWAEWNAGNLDFGD